MRANGIRARRGPLTVVLLPESDAGRIRIAYAVPKTAGGAVVRNRLKRRLRAVLADIARTQPEVVPSGAMLVSCRAGVLERTPQELRNDVVRLLTELQSRHSPGLEPR